MGLPTSREHTYGGAEPVRANDLNALQDAIIAMADQDARVAALEALADCTRAIPLTNHPYFTATDVTYNTGTGLLEAGANPWAWYSEEGGHGMRQTEILTGAIVYLKGLGGGVDRTLRIYRFRASTGVFSQLEAFTCAGFSGSGYELHAKLLATPITISTADRFMIKLEGTDAGDEIAGAAFSVNGIA
jgi:hypothetical protein